MDLNKIGKFISEERKKKNYTQKQLADILNISDRTISKWECGKGFPEVSLLQPLCKTLGISVNELLTGERLDKENYMKKAEQKMVHLVEEKKENIRNRKYVPCRHHVTAHSLGLICPPQITSPLATPRRALS